MGKRIPGRRRGRGARIRRLVGHDRRRGRPRTRSRRPGSRSWHAHAAASVAPLRPRAGTGGLGGTLVHLGRTGSTNDLAREGARRGAVAGTVFVAEEQEAGRGRQGRTWASAPGL